jgi:hypothetical protein
MLVSNPGSVFAAGMLAGPDVPLWVKSGHWSASASCLLYPLKQTNGGYKESGIGREFSLEGMLESYTHRKNVTVNLTH